MKKLIHCLLALFVVWGVSWTTATGQGNCPMPTNVVSNPTTNLTTITWNNVPAAIGYQLRYRVAGSGVVPTLLSPNNNQVSIQGLMPNTCYEFTVRAQCDSISFSNWVPAQSFCVPGPTGFCGVPSNINSNTTSNSATVNWGMVNNAQEYEFRYRIAGSGVAPTFVYTNNPTVTLNNLPPNTCYEYAIRTVCDTSNVSPSTMPLRFCTAPPMMACNVPTGISTTPNAATTTISWGAVMGAQGYELRYRVQGSGVPPILVSSMMNATTLSNLMPNTCYEFSLRSLCGQNGFSPWTGPQFFCVSDSSGACQMPMNFNASTSAMAATLTWNNVPGAGAGYQLRYRVIGSGMAPIVVSSMNSGVALNGLMPNTCYEYAVRTLCDTSGNASPWTSAQIFCTTNNLPQMDTTPPTAVCASPTVYLSVNGGALVFARQLDAGSSDNDGIAQYFINAPGNSSMMYTCADLGVQSAVLIVQDSAGNQGRCVTTVTVVDTIPPVANCVNSYVAYLNPNGIVDVTPTQIDAGSIDNCSIGQTLINGSSSQRYTQNDVGMNSALLTVIDASGNASTCIATVQVVDTNMTMPCDSIFSVMVDSVDMTSAQISWMAQGGANFYEVRYGPMGAASITTTAVGFQTTLDSLMPGTCYLVEVRPFCGPNDPQPWTMTSFCTDSMMTGLCNTTVTGLLVDTVYTTDAIISWDTAVGALGYQVRWRVNDQGVTGAYVFSNTTFTEELLFPLQSDTCYEASVRILCGPNQYGPWSSPVFFCTSTPPAPQPCNMVSNFTLDTVGINFVFFSWDTISSAQSYTLRSRVAGSTGSYQFESTPFDNAGFFQLDPATCYEVSIQTVCANDSSAWSMPIVFCSDSISFQCNRPTRRRAFASTDGVNMISQADVSWNPVMGANGYEVRYRPVGGMMYNVQFSVDTAALIRQLQPGTCYEYNVRSVCDTSVSGNLTYSFWSIVDTFCTPMMRPNVTNDGASSQLDAVNGSGISYQLFPNPTQGRFTVRFSQSLETDAYQVRIFNILGAEVTPDQINRALNGFEANLSGLPEGWYMVEISTPGERWTAKVQLTK